MDWKDYAQKQDCAFRGPEAERFFLELSDTDAHSHAIAESLEKNGVGPWRPGYNFGAFAAEWGYGYTHLRGQKDGMGREIGGAEDPPPADRPQALEAAEKFLRQFYIREMPRPWVSMNGHYPWHHYAGEFGYDRLGTEVGENINNIQWHIALNRGAAVQYQRPWFIDFSSWYGPGVLDYFVPPHWPEYSGSDRGHSLSLVRRSFYMSYMAGADEVVAESGGVIAVLPETDAGGLHKLSPYGELCREFYRFTQQYPQVGNAYVPLALLLDKYHGAYPGFEGRKAFGQFPYGPGDEMIWRVVDTFFPGGWEVQGKQETGCLVNTPYGDGIDVLLQNAPADVLARYPMLLPAGNVQWQPGEVERLTAYVRAGGTLLLNSAYAAAFGLKGSPCGRYPSGGGQIVLYGAQPFDTAELPTLLDELWQTYMPVRFSEPIEYSLNLAADYVYLMLVHNRGVTKDYHTPVQIDRSAGIQLTVTWNEELPGVIEEILTGEQPVVSGRGFVTGLEPGEIKIFKWKR